MKGGVSREELDKVNFKASSFAEWCVLMMKGMVQQKYIAILNLYTHNNIAVKYIKQELTELREKKYWSTDIGGDFNIVLWVYFKGLTSFRVYSRWQWNWARASKQKDN